jgi:hypothetical protein
MEPLINMDLRDVLIILAVLFLVSITFSLLLAVFIVWRIKKINLPPGADPITALRMTPLPVVIVLDVLDLSMDFLSAPVAWTILTYLGLYPLRMAAAIVGLIPGTQFLPMMTIAWFFARLGISRRRF